MKEVEVKIEGKKWNDAIDQAFKKANEKVHIDGFRPGKAPKEVFIKKYGEESLYFDAANLCIEDAYTKMLKDNKDLEIAAKPEMNLKNIDSKECVFTFKIVEKPTVKLGKYKGLGIKKDKVEATKEEIKNAIDQMRNRYAENVVKDGKAEMNDTVILDFEGFMDGKAFDGGKGENYNLKLGSHSFIPGFEEQLVGLKKGDKKEIKVKFPEDYHAEDLKGKEATFKVEIKDVKETIIPELDKDFFADLAMEGVETVEALEKQVKENIMAQKEMDAENKYVDDLLKAAAKNTKVEIPEEMVNEEIDRMVEQYKEHLQMQGLTLEQFYQFTGSNEQALRDQMKEEANNRVLYRLMLEEIAKQEKFKIEEKEIDEEIEKMAKQYQMAKSEFEKAFGGRDMVKYDMEMRKAIEVLKEAK